MAFFARFLPVITLRNHPECLQNVGKHSGRIRNACKMLGNTPEPSGMLAKCWEIPRNHPECPQNVGKCSGTIRNARKMFWECSGTIRSARKKFGNVPEPSEVLAKSLEMFRNHPRSLQKDYGSNAEQSAILAKSLWQ